MSIKCNKVKNPCKICLGTVTQKNGLQCQGACQSWVHYSCLNYTPGKIKDIKAGIIKVTCPCPDCKTSMPKEYRTDQPYSCNNTQCPANRPPKCDNILCPINDPRKQGGIIPPMRPQPQPCPLNKCGNDCKQFSNPQLPNINTPQSAPPCVPPRGGGGSGGGGGGGYGLSPMSSSDACVSDRDLNKCPSGCSSNNDVTGDVGVYQSVGGSMPSFHVVEQMCNTVGQLTEQINELMCRMKQAVKDNKSCPKSARAPCNQKACTQKGPKSMCPKPCFCPGNPARRN
ncbi:uncharacterized protein LOC113495103 [Trichoplusia ni]|uniref:Uncharacterized protein LOC113495103 n=1 Tax=Trichoplusia ni TaxID=7111 RepID=A0A7E5VMH1_TRINI|nr:uncharacterized protein LOC113495103 [Trichoplusia ni]